MLFVPFGVFGTLSHPNDISPLDFGAGFLTSILIETIQLIFSIGECDIGDIIGNTFGTILGIAGTVLVLKIVQTKKGKSYAALER